MKYGVNSVLWVACWTDSHLPLVDRCRKMSLDVVEIPLLDLSFSATSLRKALTSSGIDAVGCTALSQSQDIVSPDPAMRAAGIAHLKRCVDKVAEWGGSELVGVMSSAWGRTVGRPANDDEWKWSAECLHEVAQHAAGTGVALAIEPVNRYESYMVNTLEQAAKLIHLIAEPNVKILADTYHMNIEEKNPCEALVRHQDMIGHLHFSENDRGMLGTGHVDWAGVFKGLSDMRFTGIGSIEAFVLDVPEIAAATSTWRPVVPHADTLIREGLSFLRTMASRYGLS